MIPQKKITNEQEVVERCLDHFWGKPTKYNAGMMFSGMGWDRGSPAHQWTKRWVARHFNRLKKMTWTAIYKEYREVVRDDV